MSNLPAKLTTDIFPPKWLLVSCEDWVRCVAMVGRKTFDENASRILAETVGVEEDMSVQTTQDIVGATKSAELLSRARGSLAGGDSSTMRVLPYHIPLVASRGEGCHLWDADDNKYVDLNMAYGPLILGHRSPVIVDRVCAQMTDSGSQLGFPTEISMRVAEKIKILFPSMELLRFANSGTEAIASAIRLARTVTGRNKIILFEGHYHGWSEAVFNRYHAPLEELPESGFGPAIPGTTGMNGAPYDVIVVRWNDKDALERCLEEHGDSVAACMMEPIMGNAGVIPPEPGYLQELREATLDRDILLIFDEVITGIRVAAGGAQEYFQVVPDITIISKALGGGFPVAAFGASRDHGCHRQGRPVSWRSVLRQRFSDGGSRGRFGHDYRRT